MSRAFHQGRAETRENLSCRAIEVITTGATRRPPTTAVSRSVMSPGIRPNKGPAYRFSFASCA